MDAGALIAMRSSIMSAFWMLVTSVVIRVTRLADENLSIFAKEKAVSYTHLDVYKRQG